MSCVSVNPGDQALVRQAVSGGLGSAASQRSSFCQLSNGQWLS